MKGLADIRKDYTKSTLDISSVDQDPIRQFNEWFERIKFVINFFDKIYIIIKTGQEFILELLFKFKQDGHLVF